MPSAAVFLLDKASLDIVAALQEGPLSDQALVQRLAPTYSEADVRETLAELIRVQVVGDLHAAARPAARQQPPANFPLTTMVLNVTNQCNLSCTYCYEYGEDKIVETENGKQSKFMSEQTARESVEFMFKQAGSNNLVHCTFFGGETLLNLPVLKTTVEYARRRAAELGKQVDFSLTTNATLLRQDVIEWLVENRIGVTISIDGPKEMQDQFRVFKSGVGSYDIVAPKIKELLRQHRSRPIGARVTLTSQTLDIRKIYQAPQRRHRLLGDRLRPRHHRAGAHVLHLRLGLRLHARPVPRPRL